MKLLRMYRFKGWLETYALTNERVYVFWKNTKKFREQGIFVDPKLYPKVPVGTNPFEQWNYIMQIAHTYSNSTGWLEFTLLNKYYCIFDDTDGLLPDKSSTVRGYIEHLVKPNTNPFE